MNAESREKAENRVAHQIAAHVHAMLAIRGMTADDLIRKLRLYRDEPGLVEDLLLGRNIHRLTLRFLSDVAFVLGFEWRFEGRGPEGLHPDEGPAQ